jgi:hypothetical protein
MAGLLGLLVFQLVICFVLLEIVARIFDPIGISYYDQTARLFDEMIIEEPIGYRFPPGFEGDFYGVPVKINEHGMREDPVADAKRPGEFRLMAIGDSVMFSVGVSAEDSIPTRLEELANQNAPDGTHYRVLNMGVPSYNTEQELVQLEQLGLQLKPDAAFLFVIPNDLESNMWVYEKRGEWYVDLAQRSYALGLGFFVARAISAALDPDVERAAMEADGPEDITDYRQGSISPDQFGPSWLRIENSVVDINRQLKEAGVPLMVFYRALFKPSFKNRLEALGEEHGFATAVVQPWRDPRWASEDKRDYMNSPTDGHCNPEGCKIYAQIFYENLLEAGIIR